MCKLVPISYVIETTFLSVLVMGSLEMFTTIKITISEFVYGTMKLKRLVSLTFLEMKKHPELESLSHICDNLFNRIRVYYGECNIFIILLN